MRWKRRELAVGKGGRLSGAIGRKITDLTALECWVSLNPVPHGRDVIPPFVTPVNEEQAPFSSENSVAGASGRSPPLTAGPFLMPKSNSQALIPKLRRSCPIVRSDRPTRHSVLGKRNHAGWNGTWQSHALRCRLLGGGVVDLRGLSTSALGDELGGGTYWRRISRGKARGDSGEGKGNRRRGTANG